MRFAAALWIAALAACAPGPRDARPNIVVFLADDVGYSQLGFTGGTEVPTPHIDRLAAEGVALEQFYVQPVCSPTRACLLTARYAWRNGMERRPEATSAMGLRTDERTLAEALSEVGYATWLVGKWHLGAWRSEHLPLQRGFDHHYGFYGAKIDSFTHLRGDILDWHRNETPVVEEGYSTFLLADESSRLIRERDPDRPFFLLVPFNAVHGPHQAPPEYVERYDLEGEPQRQRAQLECMDLAIGRVLATLEAEGALEDTLVVFLNDNGGAPVAGPNGPYRGGKSDYHEGGIRVPAALRWPGRLPAGVRSDALLHVVDLSRTLAGVAGADLAVETLDGLELWATLAEGAPSPRTEIVHSLQVLRREDWKFIEAGASYYTWPTQPLQLYDLARDPGEHHNVAAEHPEVVAAMRARLAQCRALARPGEPAAEIPDLDEVTVFGERENERHGAELRGRLPEARGGKRRGR